MKDTWRTALLADVYAVLSAILERDVSKKLKVGAPFKVTIGNRDLEGDITRLSFRRSKDSARSQEACSTAVAAWA